MPSQLTLLTIVALIPSCLMGVGAVAASLTSPRSELAFHLGLGVSLLGAFLAIFWFWNGGIESYRIHFIAAMLPVIAGAFTLGRAVE